MKLIGIIEGCIEGSKKCEFRCCDQDVPEDLKPIRPIDYILMYPGEYDSEDPKQSHLEHIADYAGGVLARCKKECFDQSQCDPDVNYKPLDCRSYPLFPTLSDDGLVLVKDERCPLTTSDIDLEHYEAVLDNWLEVVTHRPQTIAWLSNLIMEGYY